MRLLQLLLEDRVDFLRDKYMWLLWMKKAGWGGMPEPSVMANPVAQGDAKNAFDDFVWMDPTRDKKYLQWLIRLFLKDGMRSDDFGKARRYLERFEELKPKLEPAQRDINRFRTLADLFTQVIQPNEETDATSNRQLQAALDKELKKGVRLVYKGPEGAIYQPENEDAACYLGRGTQWCTASTQSDNYFQDYHNEGPLYVILLPNGRKFQFHFETGQFMDETDSPIPVLPRQTHRSIRDEPAPPPQDQITLKGTFGWLGKIKELAEAGQNFGAWWMFENPSEQVQVDAVHKDPGVIAHFENPTPLVQMVAVTRSNRGWAIKLIKKPAPEVIKKAVELDPELIANFPNAPEELKLWVAQSKPGMLKFIKKPSAKVIRTAIEKSPYNIAYVKNPSPELQKRAMTHKGGGVEVFHSIEQDSMTDEIKWIVLKKNPNYIKFMHSTTQEMQDYVLKKNPELGEYIQDATEKTLDAYEELVLANPEEAAWWGDRASELLQHANLPTRDNPYKEETD